MDVASHVPAYLFCERFAQGKIAVDLYPPDERGAMFLARSARGVLVVHEARSQARDPSDRVCRVFARLPDLPLAHPAADLVIITALAATEASSRPEIEVLLRAARSVIQPSGLLAILVPNRDALLLDGTAPAGLPGFLDLERALRRHFPHVTLLGQQPLHGAVLHPVGRRDAEEPPILDDRMTSEQSEPPSHFLCLCSSRYRKVDDSVIAELPYGLLAGPVRHRIGELAGALAVVENESEARARNVGALQVRVADLTSKLEDASDLQVEIATLTDKVAGLERELGRRDKLITEAEAARSDLAERIAQMDTRLLEADREARKAAQALADAGHQRELGAREREDLEQERDRLASEARLLRTENKTRQRDQDEAVEQAASAQAELSALHSEASRQRRELMSARERIRRLEVELAETGERAADAVRLEAERNDLRARFAGERERFESTLREGRERLAGETVARERSERTASELGARLDSELREAQEQLAIETAARERAERNLSAAGDRLEQADRSRRDLEAVRDRAEQGLVDVGARCAALEQDLSRAQARATDLERQLEKRTDENKRQDLAIDTIARRAEDAEKRVAEKAVVLEESQAELAAARLGLEQARAAATELDNLHAQSEARARAVEELSAEIERLRPNAVSAEAARTRALAAEARVTALAADLAKVEEQAGSASARAEQLEEDLERAMAALADGERAVEEAHRGTLDDDESAAALFEQAQRILQLEKEVARLTEENETGLIKVREDLETELKYASSQLEARHGEIWEMREEIVRLRAEVAASASAADHAGSTSDFQHVLAEQESLIAELTEDREKLRVTAEQLRKSLEVRKKNLKILAAVLKRERAVRMAQEAPRPADAPDERVRGTLITREFDIRRILVDAGADMTGDPLDDLGSLSIDEEAPEKPSDKDGEAPERE
jgi:chromosome segregation ATPase